VAGFVAIWIGVIRLLRRASRMTDTVPEHAGPRIRASGWGNAIVNGTKGTNCIRVEEYAGGHAVKMHPIFGGGLVWLPGTTLQIEPVGEHRLRLNDARHDVVLMGKLREFMQETPPRPGASSMTATPADGPVHGPGVIHSQDTRIGLAAPGRSVRPWTRLGLVLVALLLLYVVLRQLAPAWVAPLDALMGR